MILNKEMKFNETLKKYFSSIIFFCSTSVYSAEETAEKITRSDIIKSDPMSGDYLMQLILGLLVVVLCIVALAWFAKKMNRFNSIADDSLKIISGMSMGTRERIVLLQVGGEQLLLGVSPGRINTLHVLNSTVNDSVVKSSNKAPLDIENNQGFADKLKSMMADAGSKAGKE